MEICKIKIEDKNILDSGFYDYLSPDDKQKIIGDLEERKSVILGLYKNDSLHSSAILDFYPDYVYFNHTGGKFLRDIFYLDVFSTALAKFYKKSMVIFHSKHRAVISVIKRIGFTEIEQNKFVKAV